MLFPIGVMLRILLDKVLCGLFRETAVFCADPFPTPPAMPSLGDTLQSFQIVGIWRQFGSQQALGIVFRIFRGDLLHRLSGGALFLSDLLPCPITATPARDVLQPRQLRQSWLSLPILMMPGLDQVLLDQLLRCPSHAAGRDIEPIRDFSVQ